MTVHITKKNQVKYRSTGTNNNPEKLKTENQHIM